MLSVTMLASAGCMSGGGDVYTYSAGGTTAADQDDTFSVPDGRAHISVSAGGAGSARVTVTDADGQTMYNQQFSGSGGSANTKTMNGAAGTWTIRIDFTTWSGGFTVTVT